MNDLDVLKYGPTFETIASLIRTKRTNPDAACRARIGIAKELFDSVIGKLESWLDLGQEIYDSIENYAEIAKACGVRVTSPSSRADIEKMLDDFKSIMGYLDEWKQNPGEFYGQKPTETGELLKVSNNLTQLYTQNYRTLDNLPKLGVKPSN